MDSESLTRLQGLQADLTAFSESRLPNLERLWAELEDSIADFRQLLHHKQKNEKSRKDLANEKIAFDDVEYSINEDFRQEAIKVADELDLDEIEAARLLLATQEEASQSPDRSPTILAIVHYHGHREALLGALRLLFQIVVDEDTDTEAREIFTQATQAVLNPEACATTSPTFFQQCQKSMGSIEDWVKRLRDRLASINVIGETLHSFALEALEYQRSSLIRQHESLAAVLSSLAKLSCGKLENYNNLVAKMATFNTFDELVIHYVPLLIAFPICVGSDTGFASVRDSRGFDQVFSDTTDKTRWEMSDFKAAASVWWLAEYSGRYADGPPGSPLPGVDLEAESEGRSDRVMGALRQGAFHFMLLVCSKIRPQLWHDPAKTGLISYLLGHVDTDRDAPMTMSEYFVDLLFDKLQIFIEALISNMPDTIRRLKAEEDEQRRNVGAVLSQPHQETSLHLERFLIIISYAFQQSPDQALDAFWAEPDGNMYGFLQWASKRQSTPRAAAFCELFQAIAENSKCADAAHKFLLDESSSGSSAKIRRSASLSWAQIFAELSFYAERLRDTPSALSGLNDAGPAGQTAEPESALMLECYLRLTAHMCRNSAVVREYFLNHPDFRLHEVLLDLCRSGIEPRFKACAFNALASLMVDKSIETSYGMWDALDSWVCGVSANKGGMTKASPTQPFSEGAMFARLRPIANGFEEANAFVRFLQTLIELPEDQQDLNDCLPFSEQLGVNYRMSGIDQYIDFVMGMVMAGVLPTLEDQQQIWELRCACLDFIRVCLSSFNEDLVVFANTANVNVDTAMSTSSLAAYVKLHPFARVMEWLFNDSVISQLFAASHANPDIVAISSADSPMVTAVARSIQVIDLVMRLQTTYFDIVRPLVKTQATSRSRQVANPTLATFEDAILANISLAVDLGLYCSTGFEHLTSLSLALLQRLASSRKLAAPSGGLGNGRTQSSRLLVAIQQSSEVDRIAAAFIGPLEVDARELEVGVDAPGYGIKMAILDLLSNALDASPSRPGLAQCLLGFTCTDSGVDVLPDSRFSNATSLFHAIARLYAETASPGEPVLPWLTAIRCKASEIIRKLAKSPFTSQIVLYELRESGFNDVVAISQQPLSAIDQFNESELLAAEFPATFKNLLLERAAYFEHGSLELRTAAAAQSLTLLNKTTASLLGLSALPGGEEVQHANIFDLFDFFEDNIASPSDLPPLRFMDKLEFGICRVGGSDTTTEYDIRLVRELLLLREAELRKSGQLHDESTAMQCQAEADMLLAYFTAENQSLGIKEAQTAAANAWVQLVTVILSDGGLQGVQKPIFILQTLQVILPKIDLGLAQESDNIFPLVKLVYALIRSFSSAQSSINDADAVPNDRLFAAFRTALNCITSSVDSAPLREVSCQIASQLLASASPSSSLYRNARKTIESAGERLLDITTEDALSSSPTAQLSALVFLKTLTKVFVAQKSQYITRALSRLNFIATLVDTIRSLSASFSSDLTKLELERVVTYLQTTLDMLLCLAKDTRGADALIEAGLFAAVRESGLLAADPDLGDIDGEEEALARYYTLLAGVLRVVGAVVLVKGKKNDGIMAAGRQVVTEGRACLVAVLKAGKKASQLAKETREALAEASDGFQVLLWGTDFLEVSGAGLEREARADRTQFEERPAAARRTGLSFT